MTTTLDVSIYDYETFDAECFKASGFERLIVGTSRYEAARDMIIRGREAGLKVEDLYAFIYYGLGWESRDLDNCLRLADELGGIKRIWLDCEAGWEHDTEAPGISVEYRQEQTKHQVDRVTAAGIQPGIYTGEYWWPSKMGNTTMFSYLPLWLANYGSNDPDNPRSPITEVNFGGWIKVAVHQYSSTIPACGRDVRDHNYWFLEEETMTNAQRGLIHIGAGDYDRMNACYDLLAEAGFVPADDCREGDLNEAVTRRFAIIALAVSDAANQAYERLGGQA